MDLGSIIELSLWTTVAILGGLIVRRIWKIGKPQRVTPMATQQQPQEKKPVELREFSISELQQFNGSDPSKPIYFSVLGKVYDVTSGRSFYGPGGAYAVFAGNECARALSVMSTNPADVGSASLEGLGQDEKDTLQQWISKFDQKYTHVGTLNVSKN